MNPSYFALQLGLATAMMAGAIVGGAFLLRQAAIRRKNGSSTSSDPKRGYEVRNSVEPPDATARNTRAVEAARLDERVLAAVKPLDLALHDLNERVTELHAQVDVTGRMLAKLASPPRRDATSVDETVRTAAQEKARAASEQKERAASEQKERAASEQKERAASEQKERAAANAMIGELAQQLGALKNELSSLKQAAEGVDALEPRTVVEPPKATSAVEEPTTLRPADTQKLTALLRAMTVEGHSPTSGRQASSGSGVRAPVCAMNPYPMGLGTAPALESRAESLRLV